MIDLILAAHFATPFPNDITITHILIKDACFYRVAKQQVENIVYLEAYRVTEQFHAHFNTVINITGHPVGRGNEYPGNAAIMELIDPVMLQETVKDADNLDILADTRQT